MDSADLVTVDIAAGAGGPRATLFYRSDLALGPVPLANIGSMIEDLVAVRGTVDAELTTASATTDDTRLHSFDADLRTSAYMRDARLRLVLELSDDAGGGTYARLRHLDQAVDYGPINVQDLPFLIEALLDDPVQVGAPRDS